jgi:uncharacterized tellurite resistance protein B-like protein
MGTLFSRLFNIEKGHTAQSGTEDKVQIATCIVLLEIANADDDFSADEKAVIYSILKTRFGLSDDEVGSLIVAAERRINSSIDTWSLTRILAADLSEGEKIEILEAVWRVIYADGRLEGYEDALVHKLAFLLDLTHDQMIAAKLKIQKENRRG